MTQPTQTGTIVVGIDGSKAAIRAALWAVDEAVSRAVPLRLLHAIEREGSQETAETAIRQAVTAIRVVGVPVEVETEIVRGPAVGSLIRSSAFAALVCVGAVGLRHFQPGRVGSTAAALAISARCPVAIIRGHNDNRQRPVRAIVVEVDGSAENGVLLGTATEEASLRGAALHAVIPRRTARADKSSTDTEGDRRALAGLDRRLARWRRRYPQLRVEPVVVHASLLDYLASARGPVDLVIVGAHDRQHLAELIGPAGGPVLQDTNCSLLIVNRQHL